MRGWEIAGERKTKVRVEEYKNRGMVKNELRRTSRTVCPGWPFFFGGSLQFTMLQEEKGGELRQEALR